MRFELTEDQRAFASSIDGLLAASDTVAVARAWADGDSSPGLKLWSRLAEQGVNALLVGEDVGGMGAGPVELVVALELLGKYAVPGPWVESVAYLPTALADPKLLGALAEGVVATVAVPPHTPYALDADIAEQVFLVEDTVLRPASATGDPHISVDRTRRLFDLELGDSRDAPELADRALDRAFDRAALATAAQLLGAGERVLADSVSYVKQRKQFGREIGSYQAIKHALVDVKIALDFARPLVFGAALDEVPASAAKVAAADAAYLASRTGLQVHGAIGYTAEFDLSLWLTKIRALVGAWGTPAHHRAVLLEGLLEGLTR